MKMPCTIVRCKPNQTVIQRFDHLESKFADLLVCSVNVGTLRGSSGEVVEMLERRSVNIYCLQEARFRGKSVTKPFSFLIQNSLYSAAFPLIILFTFNFF